MELSVFSIKTPFSYILQLLLAAFKHILSCLTNNANLRTTLGNGFVLFLGIDIRRNGSRLFQCSKVFCNF